MKFLNFFYLCGSFTPSWIRIRVPNPEPDPRTRLNPDPKQCFFPWTLILPQCRTAGPSSLLRWRAPSCWTWSRRSPSTAPGRGSPRSCIRRLTINVPGTCYLYGTGHNDFDVGNIHLRGPLERGGPWNQDFLGPEMATSEESDIWGTKSRAST